MSVFGVVGAGLVLITLAAIAAICIVIAARSRQERDAALDHVEQLRCAMGAFEAEAEQRAAAEQELAREAEAVRAEAVKKEEWLGSLERENAWLRSELDRRPPITRRTYRLLTVGIKQSGKTSLTLKWANPLCDLGTIKSTKAERYERTVSRVSTGDALVEHVFEIDDRGGDRLVDAQQELVVEEIHGLLLVVDLAGKDGKALDEARVAEQLRVFQPEALQFFFGPKTLATCKTMVLFINKADVLPGTPAEVEKAALGCFRPLIEALERYRGQMDLEVLVGSACSGQGTHRLFAHFIERILPKSAHDAQLTQRTKPEPEPPRATSSRVHGRSEQMNMEMSHARR